MAPSLHSGPGPSPADPGPSPAEQWICLCPPGCEIDVRTSSAVEVPTLVTQTQVLALAEAAATMRLAGLPVEVGDLLRRHVRPDRSAQTELFPADEPMRSEPAPAYACVCASFFATEIALARHKQGCGVWADMQIPPDRRVDQ